MQTKQQTEQSFKQDLRSLLDKYCATMELENHWQGWSECGEDFRIMVYIEGKWENHEIVREHTVIDLGTHFP